MWRRKENEMEDLMKMKLINDRIFLDGTEIKGLKSYEVKALAGESSILDMTLYVDTSGDKEEQDISNKKRDKPSVEIGINVDQLYHKMHVAVSKELNQTEVLETKRILERAKQLVIDERETGELNLLDLEKRLNKDVAKAIADEALKIYAMTKDEKVALDSLALILKAVQL